MHVAKYALAFAVALSSQSLMEAPGAAEGGAACLRAVAAADLAAKSAHQKDLRDLVVRQRPEFTALADINRDLQVLLAEMRFARFEHLLSSAPERLDSTNGLSAFRNFSWTDDDLNEVMAASPDYRAQAERLEELKTQNNGHPDWPALREFVRQEFSEEGPFKELIVAFQEHNAALETRLSDCRS